MRTRVKRRAPKTDREDAGLSEDIVSCRKCPRLVAWREEVARVKRRAYREQEYWGRPLVGFGDPRAKLAIVGLAPAAHGANRTGRMFTGDRSGDFLYAGLHRAGFANQPTSVHRDDGLQLRAAFITAPVRCAPPENLPTPDEFDACAPFMDRELALLPIRVVLALGGIAWDATLAHFARRGIAIPRPKPKFGHGSVLRIPGAPVVVGCYHVSQQNTQTGRLTPAMFDDVMRLVRPFLTARIANG
jgi:uracil-DNA glycosylase